MDKCIFNCESNGILYEVSEDRLTTILEASKQRKDLLNIAIEKKITDCPDGELKCHRNCVSTYTSKHHIFRFLKRTIAETNNNQQTKAKRVHSSFDLKTHCIFCGNECIERSYKNPSRWRPYFPFGAIIKSSENSLKQYLTSFCADNDTQTEIMKRIQENMSDSNDDALYHVDCRTKYSKKRKYASNELSTALQYVVDSINADPSRMWTSIELYNLYLTKCDNETQTSQRKTRMNILQQLSNFFKEEIVTLKVSHLNY